MNWIKVTEELPGPDERVLVWIRYENENEFEWTDTELDVPDYPHYTEPNSGRGWLIGSAVNYEITHWARIEGPK